MKPRPCKQCLYCYLREIPWGYLGGERGISVRSPCAPVSAEYDQSPEKDECGFPLNMGFTDITVDRRDITLLMDKDLLLTEFEVTKLGTEIFPVR